MKGFTLVYYTFQHEDSLEYNICRIKTDPGTTELKVKHVIRAFPFNALSGSYHFRFKSEFKQGGQNITGWIDIINTNSKAPIFNDSIYVKILRLKGPEYNKIFTAEKLQKIKEPSPVKRSQQSVSPPPFKRKEEEYHKVSQSSTNFFPDDNSKFGHNVSPIRNEEPIKPSTSTPPSSTFLFGDAPSNNNNLNNLRQQGEQISKETQKEPPKEASSIFEETTQEKLDGARKIWDEEQKKADDDRDSSLKFDDKIQKWAYTMKTRNNFRTLLVTVHEIWPFGKWEPVDLGKLLTDANLKKHYNKASIAFHPDRNRDATPQQHYLAKRIFSEIDAAFKEETKQK